MLVEDLLNETNYLDGTWVGIMIYDDVLHGDKEDEIANFLHDNNMLDDMVDSQHAGQGDIQTMCKKKDMQKVKAWLIKGGFKFRKDFDFYDLDTGDML